MLAFRSPRATDPLAPALSALSVALAGTSGGSDGASGRSSRLHRALVEKGLATDVDATYQLQKDPYLFWIDATLRPEVCRAITCYASQPGPNRRSGPADLRSVDPNGYGMQSGRSRSTDERTVGGEGRAVARAVETVGR